MTEIWRSIPWPSELTIDLTLSWALMLACLPAAIALFWMALVMHTGTTRITRLGTALIWMYLSLGTFMVAIFLLVLNSISDYYGWYDAPFWWREFIRLVLITAIVVMIGSVLRTVVEVRRVKRLIIFYDGRERTP